MKLVPDVTLVHENGESFGLPGPARTGRHDLQFRIFYGHEIEMAGMAIVENDTSAAWQARAEPCRSDKDQNWNAGFDAQPVIGIEEGIAGRRGQRARHAEPDKSDPVVDTAAKLLHAGFARSRIDVNPVAHNDVAVLSLDAERVVVKSLHFFMRQEFREAKIEDGPHIR